MNGSCSTVTGSPVPDQVRKTPNSHEPRTNRKRCQDVAFPQLLGSCSPSPQNCECRCSRCGSWEGHWPSSLLPPHASAALTRPPSSCCSWAWGPLAVGHISRALGQVAHLGPSRKLLSLPPVGSQPPPPWPDPILRSATPLGPPGPHRHVPQTETLGGRRTVGWKCLLLPEKLPRRLGTKLFSSIVNWPQDNFLSTY